MTIINVSASERSTLYMTLDSNMRVFRRRGTMYSLAVHSGTVANISFYVTGKKGTVMKELTLVFDFILGQWNVYTEGKQYILDSLGELNTLVRSLSAKMKVIVNRI